MAFNDEFIDEISQVTPNNNVTDEAINIPLQELQHNIQFLANMISNVNTSVQTGNLMNYNNEGVQTSQNGGIFNTFETKNSWLAIENNIVVNDQKIQSDVTLDLLMWSGLASTVESGTQTYSYLEREFSIPPQSRGMEMIFAIKGTGVNFIPTEEELTTFTDGIIPFCDRSTVVGVNKVGIALCNAYTPAASSIPPSSIPPSTMPPSSVSSTGSSGNPSCTLDLENKCFARYEDIVVEVLGSEASKPFTVTMGPWPNHKYYAQPSIWNPPYRTAVVHFTVPQTATSIKIRIYRTRSDGAVSFSNMFLGALPFPYSTYEMENIDINELYNFQYGLVKLNATSVLGHHVAKNKSCTTLSNLLTKEQVLHVQQFNKTINEYDWDQISGPRQIELDNNNSSSPKISVFEFDPDFTRYLHFNMKVDGPDPGTSYLGISYFVNENEFSDTITCDVSNSDCNPITPSISAELNLETMPEYGTTGTLDASGNPILNCVKKEFDNNRYVYTYYLPQVVTGTTFRFILGGYSNLDPIGMDPTGLEDYRNKWHFDYTDGLNIGLNTVCLMNPYTRIGYTFNDGISGQPWNIILPTMPNNTAIGATTDTSYCKNVKFDIYTKVVNPGDSGNPDFSTFTKTSYVVPVPKYITSGKMGYFEIYGDFFSGLSSARGSVVYFTISRDGSHPLDTFDGNFGLASTKVGVANPPDDLPGTARTYTLINPNC